MVERSVLLVLHDVAPHTWTDYRPFVEAVDALGAVPMTWLVVPDFHHRDALAAHTDFRRLLDTRVAKGETLINRASAGSLHELWRIDGTVGSTSTPAVAGDTVYFGAWDGTLRAVSATDGSPRWTRQLTTSVVDDSPLVFGNNVYVGDGTGNLHAVDRATGVTRWSRDLDPHPYTRIFSSPVGAAGRIYITARDGTTVVLRHDKENATLAVNHLDDSFSATPALVDQELYLRGEKFLYCLAEK